MYEKWLQAFHTVAMTGGFTRAAQVLNVGQPTISTHVKALEDSFRVELFHRRGRRVILTPTGERLLTITRGLYGHEEEALALLRATRDLETGQLSLNAVGPFDVMEILQVFRREHPGINTRVTLGFEDGILDGLRGFGAGVISETEFAPSPGIRTLRVSNAQMYTQAFIVCLAERRDRPLIDGFFRTAASIDPKQRGSV